MKSEILVTGATGFVGRHLVKALEAGGHAVRSHSSHDGDIANCRLPIDGVDHVFHLAAKIFVPDSWNDLRAFYSVNVMGTINVLEHCRHNRTPVTLASSYVYGQPQRLPISEDHPLCANNPYAHTKLMAEHAARFYEKDFNLRVVIVRPFNIYGPGQTPPLLIPTIVEQAMDASASEIRLKDLRPRRDYVYIADAIQLFLLTLEKNVKGVYNLGSGESASVAELTELIRCAVGTDKPVVSEEQPRPEEVMDVRADISRAACELGWRPTTSLSEGIGKVVAARRERRE